MRFLGNTGNDRVIDELGHSPVPGTRWPRVPSSHIGGDGTVLPTFTQARQTLDCLKKFCIGRDLPDAARSSY
jgi:hypothetical protein